MPDPNYTIAWTAGANPAGVAGDTSGPSNTANDAFSLSSLSGHPGVPGYELIQELGRGGTAVVYLARQVSLDRRVALKMVLAGGFATDADRQRFRAEAAAVAAVQHHGIVQVYEVGASGDRPYFALEYCAGGSLAQRLMGAPLSPRESAEVVSRVARAIHAAHTKGIVHRDLKPGNILFSADGTPKVTDFGLARRVDLDTALTRTGAVMGTPSYMAPEQARGTRAIGPVTDVYALGAVLYECLTGRPPFLAATALDTVLHAVHDDPVSPIRLQPQVPRDLETVCLKCLQKDPGKRYLSAEAVAEDLERALDGRPILARPVTTWERAWKASRRRPATAVGLAVSVLSLVLLVVVVLVANARLQRERDDADNARRIADTRRLEAIAAKEALEQERRLAYARIQNASEAVERMMTRVASEPWVDRPELQGEQKKVLEDAVAFFKCFVWDDSTDPVVRQAAAAAYLRVGSAYLALGNYAQCKEAVEKALKLRRGLATEFPHDAGHARGLAEAVGFLGQLAAISGRYAEAYSRYEEAVGYAQVAARLDSRSDESTLILAEAYTALAQHLDLRDYDRTVEYLLRATRSTDPLALRPGASYRSRLDHVTPLVQHGVIDVLLNLDGGYDKLEKARPIIEQLDREPAPNARAYEQFALTRAALHMFRGVYLVRTGKKAEGVKAARAGIDGLDKVLARQRHSFPLRRQKLSFLLRYGDLLHLAGDRLAALTAFKEFTDLRAQLLKDFPDLTWLAKLDLVMQSQFLAIRARDGDGTDLDRLARDLLKSADGSTAYVVRYNWACGHAQLVRTGPEDDRERHAAQAVTILNALLQDGYFTDRAATAHLEQDSDFEPIRNRSDYKQFLARVRIPVVRLSDRRVPIPD